MKNQDNNESPFCCPIVIDYDDLKKVVEGYQAQGKKVVLTQGVFDMYHIGHLLYLEKARMAGDILIVGIDSDELTRERKGKDRPIAPEKERIRIIRSQRFVDVVTIRNAGDENGRLTETIKPNVLVVSESTKSDEDFTKRMKKRYEKCCDEVLILKPQATTSTTARIRRYVIEGIDKFAGKLNEVIKDHLSSLKGGEK